MDTFQLIHFIVRYATERDSELTKVRLVKFLYLADLFYARMEGGVTLSKWPWAFVHFGPYCRESTDHIDAAAAKGLVESRPLPSSYQERDFYLYRASTDRESESEIERALPAYVVSQLKWAIRNWGDDTYGLLDYVYFDTEPMVNATKGDLLEFSTARVPEKPTPINMIQLPRDKIGRAKESVQKLIDRYKSSTNRMKEMFESTIYDEHYSEFVELIEEEDLETGMTGTSRLGRLEEDLDI